jgi:hypothetical protein
MPVSASPRSSTSRADMDAHGNYTARGGGATSTAVAIGGGTAEAARIFSGAATGELQGLKEYFDAGRYARDNPGLPIEVQAPYKMINVRIRHGFSPQILGSCGMILALVDDLSL